MNNIQNKHLRRILIVFILGGLLFVAPIVIVFAFMLFVAELIKDNFGYFYYELSEGLKEWYDIIKEYAKKHWDDETTKPE